MKYRSNVSIRSNSERQSEMSAELAGKMSSEGQCEMNFLWFPDLTLGQPW